MGKGGVRNQDETIRDELDTPMRLRVSSFFYYSYFLVSVS